MNVKHILNSLSVCAQARAHTHTHTGTGSLGFAKVHQIKQMRLERGMFNFEESKTQFQMHRGVINLNVSPLRWLD